MKNLYLIGGLVLIIAGLLVGAVAYGDRQYDGGFNAGYTLAQKETLALNEKAVQQAVAAADVQRRNDAQRIQRQQLNNSTLKRKLAVLKKQGEKDDEKKPDKYPANWRLTEFDLRLLQQFAATINSRPEMGTDTRERPARAAPEDRATGNGAHERVSGFIPDKRVAFFGESGPVKWPDKSDTPTPAAGCNRQSCSAVTNLPDSVAVPRTAEQEAPVAQRPVLPSKPGGVYMAALHKTTLPQT